MMKRNNWLLSVVFVLGALGLQQSRIFCEDVSTPSDESSVETFDPHIRTFPARLSERAQKYIDESDVEVRKFIVENEKYSTLEDGGCYRRRFIGYLGGSKNRPTTFRNITFDKSVFVLTNFRYSTFEDCSFRSVDFSNSYGSQVCFLPSCNLRGSYFNYCSGFNFSNGQFQTTLNYKAKYLETFWNDSASALSGIDFTDFTLNHVGVIDAKTCSFANADITDCCLEDVTLAKLSESRSFQRRTLIGNEYYSSEAQRGGKPLDFSGADFSRFNFTNSRFGYNLDGERPEVDFTGANFEGAIITNCTFCKAVGLTLEQMKSTWDWKHGRIKTVTFSKDFAKLVEEELAKEAAERSDD